MPDRYPGYDVWRKRDSLSWNDATRRVIHARVAITNTPEFLTIQRWQTLLAVCARIVPQPANHMPVPVAALIDHKLAADDREGYRRSELPPLREAWQRGLTALDIEALTAYGRQFHLLESAEQDTLLTAMQDGKLTCIEWSGMPSGIFFSDRLAHDIVSAYYSHPTSWNEIGFGGPAGPRGYVRMYFNRRDPWEAVEAKPGAEDQARKANSHVR